MKEINKIKELLHSTFNYDPSEGVFRWKVKRKNGAKINDVAGGTNGAGYVMIRLGGKQYYAHRLAWLWVNNCFPSKSLDHINGNKIDNRIENLREASQSENMQNLDSRGMKRGTHWNKKAGKWAAQITILGVTHFLGFFETRESAHNSYLSAKINLHLFQNEPRKENSHV